MIYYVIKKGQLYYNDIAACFTTFDPVGSLFPPRHTDHIWWNYLDDEDRDSAAIYQVNIQETSIRYIPGKVEHIDTTEVEF